MEGSVPLIDVRLLFSKTFDARYMSHLDLMRCFTRAVRHSNLPVWFTEGFNSHLYITFASPLSLGYESICETADIRLIGDTLCDGIPEKINSGLPFGIEVMNAAPAEMKPSAIAWARYIIELCGGYDEKLIAEKAASLLNQRITATKKTKKGAIKEIVLNDRVKSSSVSALDGCCYWDVILANSSENALNPQMLLNALFEQLGGETDHILVKRTQLLTESGEIFR